MSNYNFCTLLEPIEFQQLVCDVIQQRDSFILERFKDGRDEGIDGLYIDATNKKTVVQAKRYSNFKSLVRDLKSEFPKVLKLNPDRYILGVSLDLSPPQKEEITMLFKGYLKSGDILSNKDINNLLQNPKFYQIEINHPKLWMSSINVHQVVMSQMIHQSTNRAIFNESEVELIKAYKTANVFVSTRIYREAAHKFLHNNVIILSGEPGVGKTTMAYLLALGHLQSDHLDGFVWVHSFDSLYKMLQDVQNVQNTKKQVFILDDFWGSIFHNESTRRNDENRLNTLIKYILESNGNKRLILTTREYVLQQGLQKHPLLKETLNRHSLVCTMEDYGYDEKASILYRHLHASNLRYEYVDYLYHNSESIVFKENYNPRVLSLFLDRSVSDDCGLNEYYEELCEYLDHPNDFWEDVFRDLSEEAQFVAMTLLISSTPMFIESMETCYKKYIISSSDRLKVKSLENCISELEKTMVKSYYSDDFGEVLLKFNTPAIQDFLYEHIFENAEQSIPQLLKGCSFFNQLQFLSEHVTNHTSPVIVETLMHQCILHYQDSPDCYIEYDGSWNWNRDWDTPISEEELHRFFNLLRIYENNKHPKLYDFLNKEIHLYCTNMGSDNPIAQYADLHNLPDIIVRCSKFGMKFNGDEIIRRYYKEAFSIYHYLAMKKFEEVFPEQYPLFHDTFFPKIEKQIKDILISELEFLAENDMVVELDFLVDDIPDLLNEFGLRYTKKYGAKIYAIARREPYSLKKSKLKDKPPYKKHKDHRKESFETIKADAKTWLFGPQENYLGDDEIIELISSSTVTIALKDELIIIVDSTSPLYVYRLMETKESLDVLLATLSNTPLQVIPQERDILLAMLSHISQDNMEMSKKIIQFCSECFMMFMYREEPTLRINEFLSSEVYNYYLKDDPVLRKVISENFVLQDEQWIHFVHIPIFIFCYAFVITFTNNDTELLIELSDIFGENSDKLKLLTFDIEKKETHILFAEFGQYHFRNMDWERCLYRTLEELSPYSFNKSFVAPKILEYVNELGVDDDSKVLKYIEHCQIDFEYDKLGNPGINTFHIDDTLNMIEHLGITNALDADPTKITRSQLSKLRKDEAVCKKIDRGYKVFLHKIQDISVIKELGVYDSILASIKEIENVNARFLSGDYSMIR